VAVTDGFSHQSDDRTPPSTPPTLSFDDRFSASRSSRRLVVALSQQPRSTFYRNFVADALSVLRPPECHRIRISVKLR
jgi:hypothetical protein